MNDRSTLEQRAEILYDQDRNQTYRGVSRMFAALMVGQWLFAIAVAVLFSPRAWEGRTSSIHGHVWAAIFLGGLISSFPIYLALRRPSDTITRWVVASAQMMWSALLIHLTGGRIETHFHVFGSLAFVAFYRDWKVLIPASLIVAADHLGRQLFWPESVYGIVNPEWWRFLEHAFWVAFEDTVLVVACLGITGQMREAAMRRAEVEDLSLREQAKSAALNRALEELRASQEAQIHTEKLAAVGQLAASVGHELRNPLAAVRNANSFIGKRLRRPKSGEAEIDPRVAQFLDLIDRELGVCTKIISDLLDFARERRLAIAPCPLASLVEEAIAVVPTGKTEVVTSIPADLPVPLLDRDQFRQVVVNLVQNSVEATEGRDGARVVVRAEQPDADSWRLSVTDNGPGIALDVADRIFEPLFTTKTKGTGLGLAIVASAVKRHNGTIRIESGAGQGATFIVEWRESAPVAQEEI